jgi:hypothetical protein
MTKSLDRFIDLPGNGRFSETYFSVRVDRKVFSGEQSLGFGKKCRIEIMRRVLGCVANFGEGIGMITKGNQQTLGQGDTELLLNDLVGKQKRVEGIGVETKKRHSRQGPGIEAVSAVGQ